MHCAMRDGAVMSLGLELDGPAWGRIKEVAMKCVICGADAADLPNPDGIEGDGFFCPNPSCGPYFVTGSMMAARHGRMLDPGQTHAILSVLRARAPGHIPILSEMYVSWTG